MKKYTILFILSLGLLSGCSVFSPDKKPYTKKNDPVEQNKTPTYGLEAHEILNEANRLATLVNSEQLTRVQAARSLDNYRVKLVGHNIVDDAIFKVYLDTTIDRQNNKISGEASQQKILVELSNWQRRWPKLTNKPKNPAFANFLMKVFDLPPLAQ